MTYKRKKRRRIRFLRKLTIAGLVLAMTIVIIFLVKFIGNMSDRKLVNKLKKLEVPEYIEQDILDEDSSSRTGRKLEGVKNIVIHYVGNPGTTAKENRSFYGLPETTVNSHFIVGLKGEIIQCIPLNECSSASNWRNNDTISIEVCHPDDTGKFNTASYTSVVKLTAWLCSECKLSSDDVIRHYDITGKECPRYYVKNEDAWMTLKDDVSKLIRGK